MAPVPDLIELAGGAGAGAVRLAEVVSLAVRVDRSFLRQARRRFVPDLGPEAEADLWLGPLVRSRGPDGFVLHSEPTDWLRRRLARDQKRLRSVGELILREHVFLPPALRLEERVTYWGLSAEKSDDDIQQELARVLKALHDPRRGALNIWVDRAFERLPPRVRGLPAARRLRLAAAAWSPAAGQAGSSEPGASLADWASAVSFESARKLPFEVTLRGSTLELRASGRDPANDSRGTDGVLLVPDTRPLVVEVSWDFEDRRRARLVELRPGGAATVAAGDGVQIFLADGRGYRIEPRQERRTCFVSQGLGKKTDFATGRVLDLDASYEVLRRAVEEAGLECLRADDLFSAGWHVQEVIPHLLRADLVVADLSANVFTAAYELGIRHGLRPSGTLVVAESSASMPFDLDSFVIHRYEHSGRDVGRKEAERLGGELAERISALLDSADVDSPVYTFLPELRPPEIPKADVAPEAATAGSGTAEVDWSQSPPPVAQGELAVQAEEALARGDFPSARSLYERLVSRRPDEPYLVRRLAISIFRSEQPTPRGALEAARERLADLGPEAGNDPADLALWGEVHHRLWRLTNQAEDLDTAIRVLEKAFYLRGHYFDGLELARCFNVRAHLALQDRIDDAIADFVWAERMRRRVIDVCERLLETQEPERERAYWYRATLAEAWLGVGERERSEEWRKRAFKDAEESWVAVTRARLIEIESYLEASPLPAIEAG